MVPTFDLIPRNVIVPRVLCPCVCGYACRVHILQLC